MTALRRVDRYLLGEALGSGGMSSVYSAAQLGPLGIARPVAVKELHPHLARDADFVAMLLEEARIQGAVEHPNVVSVVDVLARGGEVFIVLALVHGVSLSEILRRLREGGAHVSPPIAVAIAIACDLLEGLHAAHELRGTDGARLGVVHRDVSPQNILVGGDGVSRVLDFGIAQAKTRAQVTRGGQLKGKPSYMSPEQLDGGRLDARSDLFAAALVVVEMLLARRACPETEPLVVRSWMSRELAEPARWLSDLGVPPALVAPLAACLSLEASERPASARALAVALSTAQPRATAAEVAAWMDEVASDLLEARRLLATRVRAAAAAYVETQPTMPTGPSAPAPRADVATNAQRPGRAGVLALAAGVLVLGFLLGRTANVPIAARATPLDHEGQSARVAAGAEVLSLSSAAVGAPVAAPLQSPPPFVRDRPPLVSASRTNGAGAASGGVPLSSAPPRASPPRVAPVPSASPRTCDPPYVVDASGVRVFKPECL